MFSPSTAGLGSHTIKYVYTDANSCTDSANTSVVVNSGSLLTFSAIPTVCGSVAPFTLTQGSPAGGKYSGIGVTNDSIFNPSIAGVGTHTITYSDSAACGAKSVVQTVTVSAGPTLVTSNDTGYCVGGSVQISVSGAKTYTWSNAGSLNNATSPTPIASPTVTTNFVVIGLDSNGCQGKDSVLVSVYPNPSIDAGPDDTVCVGDTFQLNATGAVNYRWFPGVGLLATNIPNPKGSLTGDQVYFCEGTSAHGCKATDRINIVVQTGQQVSLAPLSSVCSSDTAFALSGGTPAGGVYLGTGVVNNLVFNPALAGVGTHSITYASGLSGSCITKDSQNIVVFAGPQILWSNIGTSCEGDQPVVLSATPAGGTYSGSGVSGNTFDPTSAGGGNHIIKYEITDGNGCKASMTQSVAVNKATKIDSIFGQNNAVKSKVYSYSVKAVNGSTYQWSVTGGSLISQTANTGTVRWGKGTSGSVGVTQTNPEGCQDSARMEVAINVLGDEEFTLSGQSLRMYPNPSDDELNISFGDLRGLITITVIDALGKVVLNQEFESDGKSEMVIDLSNQVEGTYFLQLNNGEDKISKPFIIKR